MQVNSINSVAFTATSKKGNEYKKSHAGLVSGLATGVLITPISDLKTYFTAYKGGKKPLKNAFKSVVDLYKTTFSNKQLAINSLKKIGPVLAAGVITGIVSDTVVNVLRRKNADSPKYL